MPPRSEEGSRDEIPCQGPGDEIPNVTQSKKKARIGEGPKPAAPSGRNRQAERRKSQGAAVCRDYASFPGAEGDNYDSAILLKRDFY